MLLIRLCLSSPRQGIGKYTPEDIDSDLCTHITYGFAVLDGSTLTIKPHDSWADLDNSECQTFSYCLIVLSGGL